MQKELCRQNGKFIRIQKVIALIRRHLHSLLPTLCLFIFCVFEDVVVSEELFGQVKWREFRRKALRLSPTDATTEDGIQISKFE